MRRLFGILISTALALGLALNAAAAPAKASSQDDYFVKIGLYYMSTAVSSVTVVSSDGFILADTDRYGFSETQDLRDHTSLIIEYRDGNATVYDMEDNIVVDSVDQNSALISAAEDPDSRIVSVNGIKYRDGVVAAPYSTGPKLAVANYVSLEHYLWGVVPSEMGYHYGAEALKAQAVTARSFTLANLNKHAGGALSFDLCSKTHCQAYNGVSQEHESTTNACRSTSGEILTYNGKVITAYYHAYNGGFTLDPRDVWSTPLGYLSSVRDEYTGLHSWNTSFSFEELGSILSGYGLGTVQSVSVGRRLDNGAVQDLVISGSARDVTLSKNMIISVLKLKSRWFSVLSDGYKAVPLPGAGAGGSGNSISAFFVTAGTSGSISLKDTSSVAVVSSSGISDIKAPDIVVCDGNALAPLAGTSDPGSGLQLSDSLFQNDTAENGMVYFSGIGYGHGVGLCQTGANNMASVGFSYAEILNYYYDNVVLENILDAGF